MINKRKIINDPVYGFITIADELIFDIIEHPYFQRLRRIKQLGFSHYVYPGALHTRFNHALGTMHLMQQALETLKHKGHEITDEENIATIISILLHDIGHGPFSHSLENILVKDINHEQFSELLMNTLNKDLGNKLSLAIDIFRNKYHKKFLHQLVSSQLDVDRLDYLGRDSFFTGVSEGVIGTERILKMLTVHNGELAVDEKGIYSIEKFIISRRLMYWQVYLHKTVIAADQLLIKIIERAKELISNGENIFASPALMLFLKNKYTYHDFLTNYSLLDGYTQIDDYDILCAIKIWASEKDAILSLLSKNLLNRKLPKIEIQNTVFSEEKMIALHKKYYQNSFYNKKDINYFIFSGNVCNNAYDFSNDDKINILYKTGECKEISYASDQLDTNFLSKSITKQFLCYPKDL